MIQAGIHFVECQLAVAPCAALRRSESVAAKKRGCSLLNCPNLGSLPGQRPCRDSRLCPPARFTHLGRSELRSAEQYSPGGARPRAPLAAVRVPSSAADVLSVTQPNCTT